MAGIRTRHYLRWRLDQDYRARLSPEDRAYLERFDAEYYRAEFKGDQLHATPELRLDCYRRLNAAKVDAVTQGDDTLEAALRPVRRIQGQRRRYYDPTDYDLKDPTAAGPDHLAHAIDAFRKAS